MATIHVTASTCRRGPEIPAELGAYLREREWPGGGTVPELHLWFGNDTVVVWPVDPERIEDLGHKLINVANLIRKQRKGAVT